MSKILLLNPPGNRPYLRDYYCSKVAKADYLYEPTDLLILSGLLHQEHQVLVLDCIALDLTVAQAFEQIQMFRPGAVIFLSGAVSWEEDKHFLKALKRRFSTLLIGTGDIFLEKGDTFLEKHAFLDAVILDFTSPDILEYLGPAEHGQLEHITFRRNGNIVKGSEKRSKTESFEIPLPRHDLFPHHRYRYPTVRRAPFATVLTDYGCPYPCRFCVMGKLGYKVRPVKNVLEELDLISEMGFKEIYFNDQTFGAIRNRALALCEGMSERRFNFGWQAWSRVDVMDEELLEAMKAAGCHCLLLGVESANEKTLRAQRKGFNLNQVRNTFSLCRELEIRTMATFIIGLPGENESDIRRTINFAVTLDPDYASFNLLVPRAATDVRREAIDKGFFEAEEMVLDQSGTFPIMGNEYLSATKIWELKNEAFRSFYFRSGYWLRRLGQMKTIYEMQRNLANGFVLLKSVGMNQIFGLKPNTPEKI
jgi:hypothetical protein